MASESIHTCHADCPKPICVAQRRIASLEAEVAALREGILKIAADYDDFPLPEYVEKLGDWSWHSMAMEQQSIARAALTAAKKGDGDG